MGARGEVNLPAAGSEVRKKGRKEHRKRKRRKNEEKDTSKRGEAFYTLFSVGRRIY